MAHRVSRLLHLGNVVVDLVLTVLSWPERGGGRAGRARDGYSWRRVQRDGRRRPAGPAGRLRRGPWAPGRSPTGPGGVAREGIEILQPPRPGLDTGVVVSLVDGDGERTFVTARKCRGPADRRGPGGGCGPGRPTRCTCLGTGWCTPATGLPRPPEPRPARRARQLGQPARRLRRPPHGSGALPPGASPISGTSGPAPSTSGPVPVVFFDPGPLAGTIPPAALTAVLRRADWLTCNAREAALLSGADDPAAATRLLAARQGGRGVIVRTGPAGGLLAFGGREPIPVAGFPVTVLDTNGAGDTTPAPSSRPWRPALVRGPAHGQRRGRGVGYPARPRDRAAGRGTGSVSGQSPRTCSALTGAG